MEQGLNEVMSTLQQLCTTYGEQAVCDDNSVSFKTLIEDYLKSILGNGSSRAYVNKVRLSKSIVEEIGKWSAATITHDEMSRYINSWTSKSYTRNKITALYSQSHIDKVYNMLNCVLRYGVEKGVLYRNVLGNIPCPISKKFEDDIEKDLEEWEIQKVLSTCPVQDSSTEIEVAFWYTVKVLLLYTGARPGEVFAFKFSDFNVSNRTVKVCRALSLEYQVDVNTLKVISSAPCIKLLKNEVDGRKTYASRKLSVGDFVVNTVMWYKGLIEADEKLMRLRQKNKTTQYLFAWHSDGKLKKPDYYGNKWREHLAAFGIDPSQYNMYRFRHTFCTRLFRVHNLPPKTVQFMMGDNSMDMVLRVYHAVTKEDVLSASNNYSGDLDKMLGIKVCD